MGRRARIESIDALKELRTFLCNFGRKISVALDEADFDIRKTLDWLKNDRRAYWKKEVRIRQEQLVRAKLELKRKQLFEKSPGHYFVDEKRAVAAAQRRFDEAEDKLKKLHSWIPQLEKESYNCRGSLQGLSNLIELELPNRRTQIDEMICALESYVSLAAPSAVGADASVRADTGDETAAFARTPSDIERESADMEQLCRELRRRRPVKELTLETATERPLVNKLKHLKFSDQILEAVKENKKDTLSFGEGDRVVFDRSIEKSDFIYLEHLTEAEEKKTKWYAGPVKAKETGKYSACKIVDFLKGCPAMREILSLPEGWLVIVRNNSVEAVFDADDKLVGPAEAG